MGTASALFLWNEPIEMVTAGLLHSAYLYGTFGDGTRGITEGKRRTVRNRIDPESEALIWAVYTVEPHGFTRRTVTPRATRRAGP